MAVGQDDACRTVPRFHVTVEELVKSPHIGVDVIHCLPGWRNQDTHRLDDIHAAGAHDLEHIVEARRVRPGQGDDRIQIGNVIEPLGYEVPGPCEGPVPVALYRVDLSVVREEAEWLRKAPFRQGVGRKTLMEYTYRGLEPGIAQIGIKLGQRLRHDHALVADRRR